MRDAGYHHSGRLGRTAQDEAASRSALAAHTGPPRVRSPQAGAAEVRDIVWDSEHHHGRLLRNLFQRGRTLSLAGQLWSPRLDHFSDRAAVHERVRFVSEFRAPG